MYSYTFHTIKILCGIILVTLLVEIASGGVLIFIHLLSFLRLIPFLPLFALTPVCEALIGGMFIATASGRAIRNYIHTMQQKLKWYDTVQTRLNIIVDDDDETANVSPGGITQGDFSTLKELTEQQEKYILLLGIPGSGKTLTLYTHHYDLLGHSRELTHGNRQIPLYLSLKHYNTFLKSVFVSEIGREQRESSSLTNFSQEQPTLVQYLCTSELEGMLYLRPYLSQWFKQGRIFLLCDDLQAVDAFYLPALCEEIMEIIQNQNSCYITCEEVAYHEQPLLETLVRNSYLRKTFIAPLTAGQTRDFVDTYAKAEAVEQLGRQWTYTLDEITNLIDSMLLLKECTNPSFLYTLIHAISTTGPESRKLITTRGLLLQNMVSRYFYDYNASYLSEQNEVEEDKVRNFLSQIAGTARRKKQVGGISLGDSPLTANNLRQRRTYRELAIKLEAYFIDLLADEMSQDDEDDLSLSLPSFGTQDIAKMLEIAESLAFITISPNNKLRFTYPVFEEFFVAEYLKRVENTNHVSILPFERELLADVKNWYQPLRIWSGLLSDPLLLENRLAQAGDNNPSYAHNALALGILSLSVKRKQFASPTSLEYTLPKSLEELLIRFLIDQSGVNTLAEIFDQCAQEDGVHVYRFLLPLIRRIGVDRLFFKLDKQAVADLLFAYLPEAIKKNEYGIVPVLISILGKLGSVVMPLAINACKPVVVANGLTSDENVALRKAAINILGRIHEQKAVEPLLIYLLEGGAISEATFYALMEAGPTLALEPLLKELAGSTISSNHWLILNVVQGFLTNNVSLNQTQYLKIIDALLHVLSSTYEQPIQQQAKSLLLQEAQPDKPHAVYVIKVAIFNLSSSHTDTVQVLNAQDVLQKIGKSAIPFLLNNLKQQSEIAFLRIIEVLAQVHDEEVIQTLVSFIASSSNTVREQVAKVLVGYSHESVPSLVQLILSSESSDKEANEAFLVVKTIGAASTEYIIQHLSHNVSKRTQLLVRVLEQTRDSRSVQPLLELLETAQKGLFFSLAFDIVQALGQIPDKRSIVPLLRMFTFSATEPAFLQLHNEVSKALSFFEKVGRSELIAALDSQQETSITQGVRRALLLMRPFPQEDLLHTFAECSTAHAEQISHLFRSKGEAIAQFLVGQCCHPNERIRYYVQRTLDKMEEQHILQALLDANHTECRFKISEYLRKYPQNAVPRLVHLLSDSQRGDAAALTLIEFGPSILPSLVPSLIEPKSGAQVRTQEIIEALVRQHVDILQDVFRLFPLLSSPTEQAGHKALLHVLTNHLAEMSTPALIIELGSSDHQVRWGVVQALVILIRKDNAQSRSILQKMSRAFEIDTQRTGAASVLELSGEKALDIVTALTAHENVIIQQKASEVMSKIGKPALPTVLMFIHDPMQREMGHSILRDMKTEVVSDYLIELLSSQNFYEAEKALTLLLGRVRTDTRVHTGADRDQEIIPALLEHIQKHTRIDVHLRIAASLLLLPKQSVLRALSQVLAKPPYPPSWLEWLTPLFLLLNMQGDEAKNVLLKIVQSPNPSRKLYIEAISILGMLEAHEIVEEHAASLGKYSNITPRSGTAQTTDQMELAQRALGGLLVSGKWNVNKLRERQRQAQEETNEHELYSVLLGESYVQRIALLRQQYTNEQTQHLKDAQNYEGQIQHLQIDANLWKSRFNEKQTELDAIKGALVDAQTRIRTTRSTANSLQERIKELEESNQSLSNTIKRMRQHRGV